MKTSPVGYALCVAVVLLGSACAETPDKSANAREPKEYRTGSNIPVRDHSSVVNVTDVDPAVVRSAVESQPPHVPVPVGR